MNELTHDDGIYNIHTYHRNFYRVHCTLPLAWLTNADSFTVPHSHILDINCKCKWLAYYDVIGPFLPYFIDILKTKLTKHHFLWAHQSIRLDFIFDLEFKIKKKHVTTSLFHFDHRQAAFCIAYYLLKATTFWCVIKQKLNEIFISATAAASTIAFE